MTKRRKMKDVPTDELQCDYLGLFDCVVICDVFNNDDIIRMQLIEEELYRRGIEVQETKSVKFVEIEGEDTDV